jgi:ABC-type uncharacterized transport system permease subunit
MIGVTVGCFLLCYLILWALELSRLWFQLSWRSGVIIILTVLALVTHGLYLYDRQTLARQEFGHFSIPATFFDWSQIAAFGLVFAYLILAIRRPSNIFGILIMPLVIGIIAASMLVHNGTAFERGGDTAALWGYIHGGALSIAVVSVSLGFVVSVMRFWQQRRLKKKQAVGGPFRLPSLEYLDSFGRTCLITSTVCIATGLIGGAIMNSLQNQKVAWQDPGILASGLLLLWMISAIVVEARALQAGTSNAARLNLITFVAALIVVGFVFADAHGRTSSNKTSYDQNAPLGAYSSTLKSKASIS